jgi:hypothetical protein
VVRSGTDSAPRQAVWLQSLRPPRFSLLYGLGVVFTRAPGFDGWCSHGHRGSRWSFRGVHTGVGLTCWEVAFARSSGGRRMTHWCAARGV